MLLLCGAWLTPTKCREAGSGPTVEFDRAVKLAKEAVKLAKENGWLELNGLHSVRLTEAGRSLFGANDKR